MLLAEEVRPISAVAARTNGWRFVVDRPSSEFCNLAAPVSSQVFLQSKVFSEQMQQVPVEVRILAGDVLGIGTNLPDNPDLSLGMRLEAMHNLHYMTATL